MVEQIPTVQLSFFMRYNLVTWEQTDSRVSIIGSRFNLSARNPKNESRKLTANEIRRNKNICRPLVKIPNKNILSEFSTEIFEKRMYDKFKIFRKCFISGMSYLDIYET